VQSAKLEARLSVPDATASNFASLGDDAAPDAIADARMLNAAIEKVVTIHDPREKIFIDKPPLISRAMHANVTFALEILQPILPSSEPEEARSLFFTSAFVSFFVPPCLGGLIVLFPQQRRHSDMNHPRL
jgi:hypothetical protein